MPDLGFHGYLEQEVVQLPKKCTLNFISLKLSTSHLIGGQYSFGFGGICSRYLANGTEITFPPGMAHFLEHYILESTTGQLNTLTSGYGCRWNGAVTECDFIFYFHGVAFRAADNGGNSFIFNTWSKIVSNLFLTNGLSKKNINHVKLVVFSEITYREESDISYQLKKMLLESIYGETDSMAGSYESVRQIKRQDLIAAKTALASNFYSATFVANKFTKSEIDSTAEILDRGMSESQPSWKPIINGSSNAKSEVVVKKIPTINITTSMVGVILENFFAGALFSNSNYSWVVVALAMNYIKAPINCIIFNKDLVLYETIFTDNSLYFVDEHLKRQVIRAAVRRIDEKVGYLTHFGERWFYSFLSDVKARVLDRGTAEIIKLSRQLSSLRKTGGDFILCLDRTSFIDLLTLRESIQSQDNKIYLAIANTCGDIGCL